MEIKDFNQAIERQKELSAKLMGRIKRLQRKKAPSIAAATVPEYNTLIPAFKPPLIPLTIRSGVSRQNSNKPILTQSAGLPSTAHPRC